MIHTGTLKGGRKRKKKKKKGAIKIRRS